MAEHQSAMPGAAGISHPKISVVIPTRDKLELLRFAVESVMLQDYENWQLVISDNCSGDDVEGYVADLGDPRIGYRRTDQPLPVTESWNFAVSGAVGDMVMLLGNDDGLTPGSLRRIADTCRQYEHTDLICGRYLRFAYPGLLPEHPQGQVWLCGGVEGFDGVDDRRELTENNRRHLATRTANFQGLDGHLQSLVFSRSLVEEVTIDGKFFYGPWPDFYIILPLLLRASRIVVDPKPLAIVGMSTASMAQYIFGGRLEEGNQTYLLNAVSTHAPDREALPSNRIHPAFFRANALAIETFGSDAGIELDRRRYRTNQVVFTALQWRSGAIPLSTLRRLVAYLSWPERLGYGLYGLFWFTVSRLMGSRRRAAFFKRVEARMRLPGERRPLSGEYTNLRDVFDAAASAKLFLTDSMSSSTPEAAAVGGKGTG